MTFRTILFAAFFALVGVLIPLSASAGLTGYLKIEDIPGESKRAGYEGAIDLKGFEWGATNASAQVGRGQSRARAQVDSFVVSKFGDSASVYLKLAALQGKLFDRVEVDVLDDNRIVKFRYVFEGVRFVAFETGFEADGLRVEETVAFEFERVRIVYVETGEDGSAGDEHEITYDIAAGV